MAPRKNTQSAEDSLKGAQPEQAPEQAEAEQQAVAPETGQQQPGSRDEGDTGVAAGPSQDPAQAMLMAAISSIGPDQAHLLPSSMEIRLQRRIATAACTVLHDLMLYASGEPIPVSEADFKALSKAGAVIEDDWDDLAPEED